ncbi:phenylalanine--tRNA ligase subunit alpha [bacterium]|nr:phenylalanine--tRNA ligase subunit alpha [bacterium]
MSENDLIQNVQQTQKEFELALDVAKDAEAIEALRIQYLGRKGCVADLFKSLSTIPSENRKAAGQALNQLKTNLQTALDKKFDNVKNINTSVNEFDVTMPGNWPDFGRLHPLTKVTREIKQIFSNMGFGVADGPEVESEYYNFEALNIPQGHPARDMQDTLFIDEGFVLRTHTSPVQIRTMESKQPPLRIISPGRCYRRDTPDASHSPMFHQVEGLCVDQGITFADLKGVIQNFAQQLFGSDVKIRFRPSFFPFVEPGAEYDFTCLICRGQGCRVCKGTGWVEISGAGMVNPKVFEHVGYDPEKYTGFAFGMGIERIAMLLYGINDIRLFFENDIRFLQQF